MLIYVYYSLDNRGPLYRAAWQASDAARKLISRLPFALRRSVTTALAAGIYWPLARTARLVERRGGNPAQIPLSPYRWKSFYTMRTDALDRFGTRLEQRFSRAEIERMMSDAGLIGIRFSEDDPFWVAIGRKAS